MSKPKNVFFWRFIGEPNPLSLIKLIYNIKIRNGIYMNESINKKMEVFPFDFDEL